MASPVGEDGGGHSSSWHLLFRGTTVGLTPLLSVRSEISAAARDLDLLRAFLLFAGSSQDTNALVALWVKQFRDIAFALPDLENFEF